MCLILMGMKTREQNQQNSGILKYDMQTLEI